MSPTDRTAALRSPWFTGVVEAVTVETDRAKTFTLRLPAPLGHRAGQHVVLRLTAPDGYTAARSYSVASPPTDEPTIDLTVERLDRGEVSTFLHDVAEVGDELELRARSAPASPGTRPTGRRCSSVAAPGSCP